MAKNPNATLPNRNTLYIARTGGGKSQAVKQNPEIPQPGRGGRVLLWDNARDHWRGTHYLSDPKTYALHVGKAVASGRGFRLGYDGERTLELFEWFCALCWAVLDGRKETVVIVEELGRVCRTHGRAMPHHERLVSEGRKYGLRYHATNQRTQEIPKTITGNCEIRYTGPQEPDDAAHSAKMVGVSTAELMALQPLEFYVRDYSKAPNARKVQFSYLK